MSFFTELKRRKVIKVGVAYLLIAWVIAQILQLLFESFGTPDWAIKTALALLAAGFPVALFLAWVYEMTPEGLKLDRDIDRSEPITPHTIRKLKDANRSGTQLRSVVYKSRCKGLANWDLVESILASSTKNNYANAITGVLVATETHFLQVLEGEFGALNATLERISRDTRHNEIQLISFGEIEERRFGDWGMHGIGLFDLNPELAARLCGKFGEENGNVCFPSTEYEVMDLLKMVLPEESNRPKAG
ncbi:MAG: BLUF domain-containing protein [Xanthomonadales bacterium]|nr:BLUF domain-containing protein [Xanthomonadales bacterium]MDH3924064.1 BLUF domain-containing protein [Xanthomonadales bacterium]MDH4001928.1 BLUF domain-containing protein [Xanthomonadales bacterium]